MNLHYAKILYILLVWINNTKPKVLNLVLINQLINLHEDVYISYRVYISYEKLS